MYLTNAYNILVNILSSYYVQCDCIMFSEENSIIHLVFVLLVVCSPQREKAKGAFFWDYSGIGILRIGGI